MSAGGEPTIGTLSHYFYFCFRFRSEIHVEKGPKPARSKTKQQAFRFIRSVMPDYLYLYPV